MKAKTHCSLILLSVLSITGVISGDGEALEGYLLGKDNPVKEYTARVIGIIYRQNDIEDKLIGAPGGKEFFLKEIAQAVDFQEKYFNSEIEILTFPG